MVYDQPTTAFGGASDTYVFCMDLSVCTDIIYTAGGFSSENSWSLSDNAGNVVASGGNNSGIVGNAPGFDCAGACLTGDAVTLVLTDSYGDGWNGGTLTIDGVVYTQDDANYSFPYTTNSTESFDLCVDLIGMY